ncbi:MAG: DUF4296 domain-containing protein [Bacteroidetes bacterium]|jgi:hypothetical protein|nr:DUF4296 domain-containing protein [Bacteroidota bacterium]
MRLLPLLLVAVLLGTTAACTLLQEEQPPLDEDTLVVVIADLHLLEARADLEGETLPPGARDSIFAYHGVSAQAYEEAVDYYAERPRAYNALYRRVVDRLREDEMGLFEGQE